MYAYRLHACRHVSKQSLFRWYLEASSPLHLPCLLSGGTPPGSGGGGFDISRILYLAGGATLVYALYDIMKRKVINPSTTTTDTRAAAPGSAVVMPGDSVTITAVDVPATKGVKSSASTTTGSGKSTGAGGLRDRVHNDGCVDVNRWRFLFILMILANTWVHFKAPV